MVQRTLWIGISLTRAQPIEVSSHLGRFALAHVGKIVNAEELEKHFLTGRHHFSEMSQASVNPTELIVKLICEGDDFLSGIQTFYDQVKGSSSILILTRDCILRPG